MLQGGAVVGVSVTSKLGQSLDVFQEEWLPSTIQEVGEAGQMRARTCCNSSSENG